MLDERGHGGRAPGLWTPRERGRRGALAPAALTGSGGAGRRRRRRLILGAALAASSMVAGSAGSASWSMAPAAASPAASASGSVGSAGSAGDARAQRAALLLEIAELTDRVTHTQATVVGAQLRQERLFSEVADVRARVRARAVRAYIHGTNLGDSAAQTRQMAAPTAYLEVKARKERELLERLRSATKAAEAQEAAAVAAGEQLQQADVSLRRARAELDRLIAEDEVRQRAQAEAAEAARQAQQARLAAAAEAAEAAAAQAAANQAAADGRRRALAQSQQETAAELAANPDMTPRSREATRKQNELLAKYPFGVLPGGGLPGGLRATGQRSSGMASWYGGEFNGRPTATGAIYDQELFTAASRTLPLGTIVVVSRNGVRVLVLINDRGPYIDGRVIDLSAIAARALGVGVSHVEIEVVAPA